MLLWIQKTSHSELRTARIQNSASLKHSPIHNSPLVSVSIAPALPLGPSRKAVPNTPFDGSGFSRSYDKRRKEGRIAFFCWQRDAFGDGKNGCMHYAKGGKAQLHRRALLHNQSIILKCFKAATMAFSFSGGQLGCLEFSLLGKL